MQKKALQELVYGIRRAVPDKLLSIILYGSAARGSDTAESDVDIAIILDGRLDAAADDALSEAIAELNLKYDRVFSVVDIDKAELARWGSVSPYLRSVSSEGIILWQAA